MARVPPEERSPRPRGSRGHWCAPSDISSAAPRVGAQRSNRAQQAAPERKKGSSMTFDRITVETGQMSGQPCIRGLRITLRRLLLALAEHPNRDDLRRAYPDVDDEGIRQALASAAANP